MKSDLNLLQIDDSSRHVTTLLMITTLLSTFVTSRPRTSHLIDVVDVVDKFSHHCVNVNIFLRLID